MELHIKERLLIPGILPENNTFKDYNIKKSILGKTSVTDEDKKDYNIVENTEKNCIEWDVNKDQETPLLVEFTTDEVEYMLRALENLSDKTLSDEVWTAVSHIYDSFKK